MRTGKIGRWCINIFAKVMRNYFPTFSVKHFTKRHKVTQWGSYSNQYAMCFLPKSDKQLAAIDELRLSDGEIRERVWSKKAQIALIKRGNFALINRADSKDKDFIDAIVATEEAGLIAKFFRQVTPNVEYLRNFVRNHSALANSVAYLQPSVFNDLDYDDLTQTKNDVRDAMLCHFLTLDLSDKKNKVTAEHWAKEIIKLPKYYAAKLKEVDALIFDESMIVLTSVNYNFAEILNDLKTYHPVWYADIRDKSGKSPHLAAYLSKVFPQLGKTMGALAGTKLKMLYGVKLRNDEDAMAWLAHAVGNAHLYDVQMELLKLPEITQNRGVWLDVQAALMSNLKVFKAIELAIVNMPQYYRPKLEKMLADNVSCSEEARKALTIVDAKYRNSLLKKLVESSDPLNGEILLSYFPFADWPQDIAAEAIAKLVEANIFPSDRMSELCEELQEVAKERLEVQSELVCFKSGKVSEEFFAVKLHPETEELLFKQGFEKLKKFVPVYLENNELSDEGFKAFVSTVEAEKHQVTEMFTGLIKTYAQKHGLNENKYVMLMGSPYSELAPELRLYLQKEEA